MSSDSNESQELVEQESNTSSSDEEGPESKPLIKKQEDSDSKQKDSEDEEDRNQIRQELSTMSFEDLMKLKEELGSKVYHEAVFGESSNKKKQRTKKEFKRLNKNRPREETAKILVPYMGSARNSVKKSTVAEARDPRFDENCGEYKSEVFKKNYGFITEIRENEAQQLKEKLRNSTDPEEKQNLKFLIQRLENQVREEKRRKIRLEMDNEQKKEIIKAKSEGKQPHYITKKERRTQELVKQYEQLKQSGGLGKHLEKRRKKNAAKDRKKFSFD